MIYIGTTNRGKAAEIAALLSPLGVPCQRVSLDLPELGDTFEYNAQQKALSYAAHTGGLTIAEDSGMIIPALGGLPGVWSARFSELDLATHNITPLGLAHAELDLRNTERVLRLMEAVEPAQRGALLKVVLVVALPEHILFQAAAEYAGSIAEAPRGNHGFGYDPIFIGHNSFGKTLAEIDPVRKNLRSHRKQVLDEFYAWAVAHQALL